MNRNEALAAFRSYLGQMTLDIVDVEHDDGAWSCRLIEPDGTEAGVGCLEDHGRADPYVALVLIGQTRLTASEARVLGQREGLLMIPAENPAHTAATRKKENDMNRNEALADTLTRNLTREHRRAYNIVDATTGEAFYAHSDLTLSEAAQWLLDADGHSGEVRQGSDGWWEAHQDGQRLVGIGSHRTRKDAERAVVDLDVDWAGFYAEDITG